MAQGNKWIIPARLEDIFFSDGGVWHIHVCEENVFYVSRYILLLVVYWNGVFLFYDDLECLEVCGSQATYVEELLLFLRVVSILILPRFSATMLGVSVLW